MGLIVIAIFIVGVLSIGLIGGHPNHGVSVHQTRNTLILIGLILLFAIPRGLKKARKYEKLFKKNDTKVVHSGELARLNKAKEPVLDKTPRKLK